VRRSRFGIPCTPHKPAECRRLYRKRAFLRSLLGGYGASQPDARDIPLKTDTRYEDTATMRESKTAGRKIGPVPLRKPRNTGNKVSVRASGGKKRQPHRTGSARFPAPRAVPAMTGKARTRSHRTCEKPYGGTPAAGDDGNSGPNACCGMDDIFAVDSIFSNS